MAKTAEELKELAIDFYEGRIFTDRHLDNMDDARFVFMPIALGAFSEMTEEQLRDIGMIYEYMSERGPRDVNGLPTFLSFRTISVAESDEMKEYYRQYKALKESFLQPKSQSDGSASTGEATSPVQPVET